MVGASKVAGGGLALDFAFDRSRKANEQPDLQAMTDQTTPFHVFRAEFIEFRNANSWNIVFKPNSPASWDKIAEKTSARREAWRTETQPLSLVEPVA